MAKILGVDFAPLNIPMERRLQTLMVIYYTSTFTLLPVACVLLLLYTLTTSLYWLALGYMAWIVYDVGIKETSSRGGRPIEWLRKHKVWHHFRDYFPVQLHKTEELDPERNYIMGYHPHGIIGCGALCNFASDATGFSEKFPGIKPYPMTLKSNFYLPLLRGYLLYMGNYLLI